jgi:hypothetical protein
VAELDGPSGRDSARAQLDHQFQAENAAAMRRSVSKLGVLPPASRRAMAGCVLRIRVASSAWVIPRPSRASRTRHAHLRYHAAEERRNEIVIYEPDNRLSADGVDSLAELCSGEPVLLARRLADIRAKTRYWPVMKFAASASGPPHSYVAYRMSYRGEGGWLHLSTGPLSVLVRSYVRHIGTDKFFELL